LEEFFRQATPKQAYDVACQITKQVRELGDVLLESKSLKSLLWTAHDSVLLSEQWTRFEKEIQELLGPDVNPAALVSELVNCADKVRLKELSVVHGDLHISNVALDVTDQNVEAYIFDAGVTKQNVAGRDFAVLEVSMILHQRIDFSTIVQLCAILYGSSDDLTQDSVAAIEDPVGKCTVEFIRGLRAGARSWNDPDIYALMVVDFALIQVQGLAFGSSGNRIWDQRSAAYLLAVVARWYQKLRNVSTKVE
jgi:hypothetical protein